MARKPARLISVAQLAALQGVSRKTALRRLLRANAVAGGGLVIRYGRKYFTTITLLAKADPRLLEEQGMLRADVDLLKEKVAASAKEITRLRARVAQLERAQIT